MALLTGLIAKEMVVSLPVHVLRLSRSLPPARPGGGGHDGVHAPCPPSLCLVFILLYVPCVAAVSTLAKEMNSTKWTLFSIGWQLGVAYVASLLVYQVGSLFL